MRTGSTRSRACTSGAAITGRRWRSNGGPWSWRIGRTYERPCRSTRNWWNGGADAAMSIPANDDSARAPADEVEALLLECLRAGTGLSAQIADLENRGSPDARRTAKLLALLEEVGFLQEPGAVDPRLPERIGDYRVLSHLGSGGMGVVYLAEHMQLRRRVALKVIHRDLAATEKVRARFKREALAASRLDHPGICTIYEVGTDGEQPFLAMRYVAG